jgi:transposase-like protein
MPTIVWMYLYRVADSEGNPLAFLLSPTPSAKAAKRFFVKTLHLMGCLATQAYVLEAQGGLAASAPHTTRPAASGRGR